MHFSIYPRHWHTMTETLVSWLSMATWCLAKKRRCLLIQLHLQVTCDQSWEINLPNPKQKKHDYFIDTSHQCLFKQKNILILYVYQFYHDNCLRKKRNYFWGWNMASLTWAWYFLFTFSALLVKVRSFSQNLRISENDPSNLYIT